MYILWVLVLIAAVTKTKPSSHDVGISMFSFFRYYVKVSNDWRHDWNKFVFRFVLHLFVSVPHSTSARRLPETHPRRFQVLPPQSQENLTPTCFKFSTAIIHCRHLDLKRFKTTLFTINVALSTAGVFSYFHSDIFLPSCCLWTV